MLEQKNQQRPGWELQQGKNSFPVAEPRHRVGPKGVSSGVSFRDLPEPCFHQLRKICLHYTEKCSGKYENNKMAARYVHQLANEVLFLLSGISEEIQMHQDIAKLAEQRLREWNTNFPESLKAIGNPHDIANLISAQKSEIRTLTKSLEIERSNKQRDMSYAMKSMDCQLHASRNGALNERQKLGMEYETLKSEMEGQLNNCARDRNETVEQLHLYYATELKTKTEYYEGILTEHKSHTASLLADRDSELQKLLAERDGLIDSISRQKESFKAQVKVMQERLDNQLDVSSVATDDSSLDDLSLTEASSITDSIRTSNTSSATTEGSGVGRRKSSTKNCKKRLRRLMKELTLSISLNDSKNEEITELSNRLRNALGEIKACYRKINSLGEVNEGLRYHMLHCCRTSCRPELVVESRDFHNFEDERHLMLLQNSENLNVLQHSPHFLHHSGHQAQMKNVKLLGRCDPQERITK